MPSKLVTDRQKSALSVASSAETEATRIGNKVAEFLAPLLQAGEAMPDLVLCVLLIGRLIMRAHDRMVNADQAHLNELADDSAPRAARDAAATTLYNELLELRDWCVGLYGVEALRLLGFSTATPRDPVALSRFAGEVVTALNARPQLQAKREGVQWDPTVAATRLQGLRVILDGHLKDVAREGRQAQRTLIEKKASIESYDDTYARAAAFLMGVYRLAGEEELAERVRPTTRRASQSEDDEPPTPPATSAAPVTSASPAAPASSASPAPEAQAKAS
jgi:hypothetical protein